MANTRISAKMKKVIAETIEARTGHKVRELKKVRQVEELGKPVVYITAELTVVEKILRQEIIAHPVVNVIYLPETKALLTTEWTAIGA